MSWGGSRPGAGRKSNAQIERCHGMLDKAVSEADWDAIFKNQFRIAATGDGPAAVQAAKFLARYRWGEPAPAGSEPEEENFEPIKIIEVHHSPPRCSRCPNRDRYHMEMAAAGLDDQAAADSTRASDPLASPYLPESDPVEDTPSVPPPSESAAPAPEPEPPPPPPPPTPEQIAKAERGKRLLRRRKWGNWTPLPRPPKPKT